LLLPMLIFSSAGGQSKEESLVKIRDKVFYVLVTHQNKDGVDVWLKKRDRFKSDGSYYQALPTISEAEKEDASKKFEKHKEYLKDVLDIAYLYTYDRLKSPRTDDHLHDTKYRDVVMNTLEWWFEEQGATPTHVYHQSFNYQEWNTTTFYIMNIGLSLFDDFHATENRHPKAEKILQHMEEYCHHVINSSPQLRGPNWAFRWDNCLRYTLLINKPEYMDEYRQIFNESLSFNTKIDENQTSRSGIYPDWSILHHGDIQYLGMYGLEFVCKTMMLVDALHESAWEFNKEEYTFLKDILFNGTRWVIYRGNVEYATTGKRACFRNGFTDATPGKVKSIVEQMIALSGDKLNHEELQEFHDNIDTSFEVEPSDQNIEEIEGSKVFWYTDYHVHRRKNYSFAVKRMSLRTRGPEDTAGNSKSNFNLHYGSGYTSLLQRNDEVRLSRLGWNFCALPGTTLEQNQVVAAGKAGSTKRNNSLYSQAVADGMYSFAAMQQELAQFPDGKGGIKNYNILNGALANKAYFFFDKEMVCLGNNVRRSEKTSGTDEIWTTPNQTRQLTDIYYQIDDQTKVKIALSETVIEEFEFNKQMKLWHDGFAYISRLLMG